MPDLWSAFAETADADSAAPALILRETVTSLGELKVLAECCAAALAARGVVKGDVVALQLPKRRISYALLLACLRLGAPYVFLDPRNPAERTRRMVAKLRPRLLFSMSDADNAFGPVLKLSDENEDGWLDGAAATDAPTPRIAGTDPAYVMFTSGSTGEPKGAVIPHQGVLSLIAWSGNILRSTPRERVTAINPLHFDNSVFDVYCGLFNGAALVPVETSEVTNPASWVKIIRAGKASVMFAVPTLFLILDQLGLLTPRALPDIRTFQFGGEGYPIGKLRDFHGRFAGHARLINVYGPTETSCICSSVEITPDILSAPDSEFPPLGAMHPDFTHAILDDEQKAVPRGEPGELWIGGPCVGLGYFANAEETAARFRQDPQQGRYRTLLYRTGDRVREDEKGQLWFHGRVDNQVKIRGHRIELEEVDLAVQSLSGIRRAVAVVLPGVDGDEIAVAFAADRTVEVEEIRTRCRDKLPTYMCPAKIIQLDDLPRNANGKVDRKATRTLLQQMA